MGWSMRARVSGVRRPLSQATRQKLSMLLDSRNARYASQMVMSSGVVFWCSFWCHCSMNPSSMPCNTMQYFSQYSSVVTLDLTQVPAGPLVALSTCRRYASDRRPSHAATDQTKVLKQLIRSFTAVSTSC